MCFFKCPVGGKCLIGIDATVSKLMFDCLIGINVTVSRFMFVGVSSIWKTPVKCVLFSNKLPFCMLIGW